MRHFTGVLVSIFLLPVFAGCGPAPSSLEGFKHPEFGGLKRASFELQCPQDKLQAVELALGTMGVTGCGKRAVYKHHYIHGWMNNTGGSDDPKGSPPPEQK